MEIKKEDFLTDQEIDVILEAMVLYEDKDFTSMLVTGMLEAMMPPKNLEQYKKEKEKKEAEAKTEKKLRIERSIFLKAKLLKLRDMLRTENLCEDTCET